MFLAVRAFLNYRSMGWLPVNPEKAHILRSGTGRGFVIALHDEINGFLAVCSGSKPLHCIGSKILSNSITGNNSGQKGQEWSVNRRQLRTWRPSLKYLRADSLIHKTKANSKAEGP